MRAAPVRRCRSKKLAVYLFSTHTRIVRLAGTGPANIDLADDILADDILAGELLDDPDFGAFVPDLLAGFPPSNYPFP